MGTIRRSRRKIKRTIKKIRKITRRRAKRMRRRTSKIRNKKTKIKKIRKKKIKRKMAIRKKKISKNRSNKIKIKKTRKKARRTKNVNLLNKRNKKRLSTKLWTSNAKESQKHGHGSKIRVTGSVKLATKEKYVLTFATTTFPSKQSSSAITVNGWTLDLLMTSVSKSTVKSLTINSIKNLLYILILTTKPLIK